MLDTEPQRNDAKEKGVTLDCVPAESRVEVLEVGGGQGAKRHLAQLGIRVGETVVVQRVGPMGGPILVESRGSSVAVGRALARKVLVRVAP